MIPMLTTVPIEKIVFISSHGGGDVEPFPTENQFFTVFLMLEDTTVYLVALLFSGKQKGYQAITSPLQNTGAVLGHKGMT